MGLALYLVDWPTIVLQCSDAVGWVIWSVKSSPIWPTQSINQLPNCCRLACSGWKQWTLMWTRTDEAARNEWCLYCVMCPTSLAGTNNCFVFILFCYLFFLNTHLSNCHPSRWTWVSQFTIDSHSPHIMFNSIPMSSDSNGVVKHLIFTDSNKNLRFEDKDL